MISLKKISEKNKVGFWRIDAAAANVNKTTLNLLREIVSCLELKLYFNKQSPNLKYIQSKKFLFKASLDKCLNVAVTA